MKGEVPVRDLPGCVRLARIFGPMASTYGDGDPDISPAARAAHDVAVAAGLPTYIDPVTRLDVFTARELTRQGECCGAGCRHCPYPAPVQRGAGRLRVRPESSR